MNAQTKIITSVVATVTATVAVVMVAQYGFAWTSPVSAPPLSTSAIAVSGGNVAIGTATPDTNYRITTSGGGVKAENSSAAQPAGYFSNAGGGPAITAGTGGMTLGGVNRTSWPSGGMSGSGTANYMMKFTATSTLGNSLVFDNGTNIGIGTAAPAALLDVKSQLLVRDGTYVEVKPGGNQYGLIVRDTDSNSWGNIDANDGYLALGYGNDNGPLFITGSNVGIGTSTVDTNYRITISGGGVKAENSSATQPAGYFSNAGGGPAITAGTGGINLGGTTRTTWPSSGVGGSGTTNYISKWTAGTTQGNSQIFDNGTNVGIGTASPNAKLHVSSASGYSILENTTAGATGGLQLKNAAVNSYIGTNGSRVYVYAGDATTEDVTILNNGNVGIGATTPQTKLHVNVGVDQNIGLSSSLGEARISTFNDAVSAQVPLRFEATEFNFLNGNVGIGTTAAYAKLSVAGNVIDDRGTIGNAFVRCSGGVTFNSSYFDCNSPLVTSVTGGEFRTFSLLWSVTDLTLSMACLALGGTATYPGSSSPFGDDIRFGFNGASWVPVYGRQVSMLSCTY